MLRTLARWALTIGMVFIGVLHFTHAEVFVAIMPDYLPWHLELVWLSGAFEILGGLGLQPKSTRRAAGIGLIALYIAVLPANIHMAIHGLPFMGQIPPPAVAWGRLPLQLVFIAWAWWVSRRET